MKIRELVGNDRLVRLLSRAPLPQTSLFAGPEGIGKKTLALALAALANCKSPSKRDLCGRCAACVKAAAGNHPDILLFQPENQILRIDAMRELSREVQYRPFEGRSRFFIIDQAQKMTEEAANSILKTLEEPPETSRIALISAFPHRLLATIRSRCQIFSFQALDRITLQAYLKGRFTDEEAELRAAFSDGSIGTALSLDLEETLKDRNHMLDLLACWCSERSFQALYRKLEGTPLRGNLKKRERVRRYLDLLQLLGEDVYFIQMNTPERVVNRDRIRDLEKLAAELELSGMTDFLYHVSQSRWEVDHYLNPLMCFEALWLRNPGKARC